MIIYGYESLLFLNELEIIYIYMFTYFLLFWVCVCINIRLNYIKLKILNYIGWEKSKKSKYGKILIISEFRRIYKFIVLFLRFL